MDEFIDELIRQDTYCDVTLPRISKRHDLEEEGTLEPYISALAVEEDEVVEETK
jgi:pre-mRNA-splicing factor 38A